MYSWGNRTRVHGNGRCWIMIITKRCYDCGEDVSFPESEVFDGIVARPVKGSDQEYKKIWLCVDCRQDAVAGGEIFEEDIDLVDESDDYEEEVDP